ncbi:MAG: hypothetical protein ACLGIT_17625 [Gammaproteobacteria bacterium]
MKRGAGPSAVALLALACTLGAGVPATAAAREAVHEVDAGVSFAPGTVPVPRRLAMRASAPAPRAAPIAPQTYALLTSLAALGAAGALAALGQPRWARARSGVSRARPAPLPR